MPFRLLFVAAAFAAAGATPALAGGYSGERVYADAYGNLVIESRAGFKRIMVGKGYMAGDYQALDLETPRETAYLERDGGKLYLRRANPCTEGVLIKGRSYMYGLPDGVLPVLVAPCR
mgnify:CR=1 FL=1